MLRSYYGIIRTILSIDSFTMISHPLDILIRDLTMIFHNIMKKTIPCIDRQTLYFEEEIANNKKNLNCISFELIEEDFHFFKKDQFKNYLKNLNNFEIPDNFILTHYDEKWEVQAYAQSFYKAKKLDYRLYKLFLSVQ